MKSYRYNEPSDTAGVTATITKTVDEILAEYWNQWRENMERANKDPSLISKENCVADWVTIHWAWDVKNEHERSSIKNS